jgi:hypothetical protein
MKYKPFLFLCLIILLLPNSAIAAETQVRGKVTRTEGHLTPTCRRVFLKRNDDGAIMTFRIPDTGADESMLAVSLTALTTGLDVQIDYDSTVTTGCGTEPRIIFISVLSVGTP